MLRDTEFKERLLRLLREDVEFRHAVTGLIGLEEIIKRLDKFGEAIIKLREEITKGFETYNNDFKQFREEISKGFKKYDVEFEKMRKDTINTINTIKSLEKYDKEFEFFKRYLLNLDMHWDLISEKSFREKLREIIDKEIGLKIEKWVYYDNEGVVYDYPSRIEADVITYNNNIILMEFLPYVSVSDVESFKKKAMLYERIVRKKPSRLIIITSYADEKSLGVAKELDIEIHIKV
ncbi:MAG: DUF3782 domain-containing protein [Nitrososphaerota archaeon]